jgi:hypothetical protein
MLDCYICEKSLLAYVYAAVYVCLFSRLSAGDTDKISIFFKKNHMFLSSPRNKRLMFLDPEEHKPFVPRFPEEHKPFVPRFSEERKFGYVPRFPEERKLLCSSALMFTQTYVPRLCFLVPRGTYP